MRVSFCGFFSSWSEGGRGWLHKSVESPKMWSLGLSKFSRVLCAVVGCELVECSARGKGEAQGFHAAGETGREGALKPLPGALCLTCTCCVILGRCLNVSGPQLVYLKRQEG